MTQRPSILCQLITLENLSLLRPINAASLIGDEVLLRIGRGGFSLGYVPLSEVLWRSFPPRACASPEALLSDPNAEMYAALANSVDCIGLAGVTAGENGFAEILDLRVDAAYRRCHVASALLDMCEEFARRRSLRGLKMTVTDTNPVACQFLEAQGFSLHGVDRMAYAYAPSEVDKPLARRACALTFYRLSKKG